MLHDIGQLIATGGIAVWLMLGLAAFAVAVIWERAHALFFQYGTNTDSFYKHMKALVMADKVEEAISYCSQQGKALLPRMVKIILERADRDDESLKTAHDIASMELVPQVTKRLGYLAMVANVATLIGLLGTIHGLIQSFQAVSFADPAQKQTLLAQGISISMNTTALGLLVAIPVMIVFSFLQARQNKIIEDMIATSAKIVDLLTSRHYQAYDEGTAFPSTEIPVAAPKSGGMTSKRKAA